MEALTESVESFLRFALRDSNFSNALFKVTVGDGEQWRQCLVEEALSLVTQKRGFICLVGSTTKEFKAKGSCEEVKVKQAETETKGTRVPIKIWKVKALFWNEKVTQARL